MIFQRTATPPLTSCLSPRVHSTNAVPSSRPHPRLVMSTAASSQWHVCHSKLSHVVGSPQLLVHIACVKTVSEPLELEVMGICFERKADSPSCCFFEKVVRKRRANRPGYCAPKAGALPGCATPRRYIARRSSRLYLRTVAGLYGHLVFMDILPSQGVEHEMRRKHGRVFKTRPVFKPKSGNKNDREGIQSNWTFVGATPIPPFRGSGV